MGKVGIITDSIHGLPAELIQKYGIRVASMGVNLNNKGYRDMIDIFPQELYQYLRGMSSPGTTSAATPGDFLKLYQSFPADTDSLIYIGVSKVLTATFENANQARQIFQETRPGVKIELIDSKNCMGAMGFVVLEAARAAEAGRSFPEVMAVIQNMIPRVKYLSVLETLDYLARIGRMPKGAATPQTSNLRPLIGNVDNNGALRNFPPVPAPQAVNRLVELAATYIEPQKPVHAIIHFSDKLQEAEEVSKALAAKFQCNELYMSEYSPAALCATGTMTGLAFYI